MKSLSTQLIILTGLLGLSLLGSECQQVKDKNGKKLFEIPPKKVNYFAEIPASSEIYNSEINIADFNGDGYPDMIIPAGEDNGYLPGNLRFYYFENDGKGNFKSRKYPGKSKILKDSVDYFAEIPHTGSKEMFMKNVDADNDGDRDLIVGSNDNNPRFHFFENDGKGNFKLRTYDEKKQGFQ